MNHHHLTEQQELASAGMSEEIVKSRKRKTLEDLFRPPIDLIHKGSFHSVSAVLATGQISSDILVILH